MKTNPLVSVVLATKDPVLPYLEQALASVRQQTYTNWELIVVDDGSRMPVTVPQAKIIRNQVSHGLTKSLNQGIRAARGEYIARLDDDDWWLTNTKLERQVALLEENKNIAVCGGSYAVVDESGHELYKLKFPTANKEIRHMILRENPFPHGGVLLRTSALLDVGLYDERYRYAQDFELWLRLGGKYELANLPDFIMAWRQRAKAVSGQHSRAQARSFLKAAFLYRQAYPHFYRNLPHYFLEEVASFLRPRPSGSKP